jgi:hypothetical protein
MLSSFARETITRLRYPTVNDQGTTVPDYTANPDEADIAGCWLEPTQSIENDDGRLAVQTGFTVAAPPAADITAKDRARYLDTIYEVIGDPMPIKSPTGALDSTKLFLRRWEG